MQTFRILFSTIKLSPALVTSLRIRSINSKSFGKMLSFIDTILGICWVGVGECLSENPIVYFGAKPTQSVCARDLPWDRKKTREGRSSSRTEKETKTEKWTEETNQQERAVKRSRGKSTARTCGHRGRVGQRERMSQRSRWLCGNFARIHARASPQMHRNLRKRVTKFSLFALGANPSPWLFVLLFFHPLCWACCVLYVRKEIWNTPVLRWKKTQDDLMAMSGWDCGDRLVGGLPHFQAFFNPWKKLTHALWSFFF